MARCETEEPQQRQQRPRRQRDPTVHNAEDDEMRFSGLHPKSEIPSKSFSRLNKIPPGSERDTNHVPGDCPVVKVNGS